MHQVKKIHLTDPSSVELVQAQVADTSYPASCLCCSQTLSLLLLSPTSAVIFQAELNPKYGAGIISEGCELGARETLLGAFHLPLSLL